MLHDQRASLTFAVLFVCICGCGCECMCLWLLLLWLVLDLGFDNIVKVILRSRLPKPLAEAVDREAQALDAQARRREEKKALMRATCTVGVVGSTATATAGAPSGGGPALAISVASADGDGAAPSLDSLASPMVTTMSTTVSAGASEARYSFGVSLWWCV